MKKSERLNQELIFLKDKQQFKIKDLMMEFQISRRTALRDVEDLEKLGLPFYTELGRYGGYQIINQAFLSPVFFSNEEIQAIFFALNAQSLLSSTPFEKSYVHIRQKLLATLPKSQQAKVNKLLEVVKFYGIAPVKYVDSLAVIMQSILEEKRIQLLYKQYYTREVLLQIAELFYREGIWFCSALDVTNKQWGTYRCDYMEEIKIIENAEQTHTLQELRAFQEYYEKNFHDISFRCRLSPFGKELFLKHHYPNMLLEEHEGVSYLTGGYNQEELDYMVHYLISYGKHLVIEYPKQLQESYIQSLEAMISKNH